MKRGKKASHFRFLGRILKMWEEREKTASNPFSSPHAAENPLFRLIFAVGPFLDQRTRKEGRKETSSCLVHRASDAMPPTHAIFAPKTDLFFLI